MNLTKEQKKFLRSLAHERKVIIWIGQNGLTENLLAEIDSALNHHELVKIKIRVGERELRDEIIESICNHTSALLVQKIGNTITLYKRKKNEPVIIFPG